MGESCENQGGKGTSMADEQGEAQAPRKKKPHATREVAEERIELVRKMLVDGYNPGDIKRLKSAEWGIGRRATWQYILLARRRTKQSLRLSADEACATSIEFWSRQKLESQMECDALRKQIAEVEERERDWTEALDSAEPKSIESISIELTRLGKKIDSLHRRLTAAQQRETKAHDRIDVILGTRAPTKIAVTDAAGNDLPRDPHVIETRLVALGFNIPQLPGAITDAASSRLATLPGAVRLEASARLLDSGDVSSD